MLRCRARVTQITLFIFLTLVLVSFFFFTLAPPLNTSAQTSNIIRWEYYNTGNDTSVSIYGVNWAAQTFTIGNNSHDASTIRIKVNRVGEPGLLYVSLRATSVTDPSGSDISALTTTYIDGDLLGNISSWYDFTITTVRLVQNTQYAIVVRAPYGNSGNYIQWAIDGSAATYTGGQEEESTNAGTTWTGDSDDDFMFEIWGESLVKINSAAVFGDYIEDGDWLITMEYENFYYYPSQWANPARYFYLQLLNANGTAVLAQSVCRAWGNKPGSIYLNENEASALDEDESYYIRIYGDFGNNPSSTYQLTDEDWQGTDLALLDDWVLLTAGSIGDYYDIETTDYIAGYGNMLNLEASGWFDRGIPALTDIRPNLFQVRTGSLVTKDQEDSYAYKDTLWADQVGDRVSTDMETAGSIIGLSGQDLMNYIILAVYVGIALFAVGRGYAVFGLVMAFPVILVGVHLRAIDIVGVGVGLAVLSLLLVSATVWSRN